MKEIWKPLKYNTRYEISNYGKLRSNYTKGNIGTIRGELKGMVNNCGYQLYSVKLEDGSLPYGYRATYMAHRLVVEHFIGDIPEGMEVDHLDGDRMNNYVGNLEVVSHKENIKRSYERGREVISGDKHYMWGRKHKKSTKRKMAIAKIGENHPKFSGWYVVDGVKYGSTYEAMRATGVNYKTIGRRCKGNAPGYSFIPKLESDFN